MQPGMDEGNTLIYVVCGEASGDALAARIVAALRRRMPGLRLAGVGGPRLAEQGVDSLFPLSDLAVMGLVEIIPRIRLLRRRMRDVDADIAARRPDLVLTVDSSGFTHRILALPGAQATRRVHTVAPQVWAWRAHRVKRFPGLWDTLLCLLPFEPAWFAARGVAARFIGHPVLESGAGSGDAARFRLRHAVPPEAELLVLMPGSRRSEVSRLLPIFGRTLALLAQRRPGLVPVLPVSPVVEKLVRAQAATWPSFANGVPPILVTELEDKHDAYAAAAAALTKSGTSTLELALAGVPMAVTYRVHPVSAALARRMIQVKHVAMVNILADRDDGREVVPELLQERCTPETLAETVLQLLDDAPARAAQRAAFTEIVASLQPPGGGRPSDAAADAVLELLQQPRGQRQPV